MLKDILEGKPFRHPLHPMLVHFPIGLFLLSLLLDLGSRAFPQSDGGLVRAAFYSMLVGVIGALLAAVPGLVDYTEIRRDRPGKVLATTHMILNLLVVALYGVNLGVRAGSLQDASTPLGPLMLSCIAFGILGFSGYLGGRMVYDEGIGVGKHRRRGNIPDETIRLSSRGPGAETTSEGALVPVPQAERLNDRENLRVEIDGQAMVLLKAEGNYYAFQDFCTHRFGPLSEGAYRGNEVECPWHRSCFDVRTGKVLRGPAKEDLKTFRVEMRDGKVWVAISRESQPVPASQPHKEATPRGGPGQEHH